MTVVITLPCSKILTPWGAYLFTRTSTIEAISSIVNTFLLALLFNSLFQSPYRVWRELHALAIRLPRNATPHTENIAHGKTKSVVKILLKNRSSKPIECRVRVKDIKSPSPNDRKYNQFPWPVSTIILTQNSDSLVDVASGYFNDGYNYTSIPNERPGTFAEGSVMDFEASIFNVLIEVSTEKESEQVWCKIVRNAKNKTLTMEAIR